MITISINRFKNLLFFTWVLIKTNARIKSVYDYLFE